MLFSRTQLDQLAKVNQFSINTLIAEQKKLNVYKKKKIDFQKKIKQVVSSKSGDLASGSSLLMGRINTQLLLQYGYSDMAQLIKDYEDNEVNIENVSKTVATQDKKIKESIKHLKGIDVTKDMSTQVTQEVLLDSKLADVRNNSQEILLMLSQSKTGKDLLNLAATQIAKNEKAITDYITANKSNTKKVVDKTNSVIQQGNDRLSKLNTRISDMSKDDGDTTILSRLNKSLTNMSTAKKNGLLGVTFLSFFTAGLYTNIKNRKVDNSDDSNKGDDNKEGVNNG